MTTPSSYVSRLLLLGGFLNPDMEARAAARTLAGYSLARSFSAAGTKKSITCWSTLSSWVRTFLEAWVMTSAGAGAPIMTALSTLV